MTINKTKLKKIIKEEAQKYLKEYDDYAYDIANDSDWQESQRYEEEETKKVWNTLSRAVQRKVKKNANDWKKRDELYMKLTAALDKIDDAQDNSYYADMIIEMAREGKFTSDVSDLDDESPVAATKKAHRMSQQRRYARKTAPVPPRLGMVESKSTAGLVHHLNHAYNKVYAIWGELAEGPFPNVKNANEARESYMKSLYEAADILDSLRSRLEGNDP